MKKIVCLSIFIMIALSSMAQSKDEAIAMLKLQIMQTNKSLPIKNLFITLNKMEIKDGNYIVSIILDEKFVDLNEYVNNIKKNKSELFDMAANRNENFSEILIKSGLNLKFVVSGLQSKRQEEIILTTKEMKEFPNMEESYSDYMNDVITELQNELPENIGDGLTMTSIYIENNYVHFKVKTDDTIITIPLLKRIKSEGIEIENGILESLAESVESNDPGDKLFVNALTNSGMGIVYIYWSQKSSQTVTFTITPEMISWKLGKYKKL